MEEVSSQADRSPAPITPELIKQLEKEDEELFLRFGSRQAYNKPKKKEIPRHRLRRVQRTEATQLSGDKQDGLSFNETSISDKKDIVLSEHEKDTASISGEKRDIANLTQTEKLESVLILTVKKLPNAAWLK